MKSLPYIAVSAALILGAVPAGAQTDAPLPSKLPLDAFAQLPRMQNPELSPDGKFIAYFYPIDGRNHIVMQPLADGDNRQIVPPAGDLDFKWLQWANDDRLVFAASFFGERFDTETEETRLASIKKDGSDLKWIVKSAEPKVVFESQVTSLPDIPPQVQDDVISWLPEEPNHILVALDADFNGQDEVRRIDVSSGDYTLAHEGLSGVQNWLVDANNELRMGYGYNGDAFDLKFLGADGDWTSVTSTDWWGQGWQPVAFTDDAAVMYVIGLGPDGGDVVRKMNVESGEFIADVFSAGEFDVEGVQLDSRTRRPIGVSYTDDVQRIKYFDSDYDRLQRTAEKAFKDMHVRLLSLSEDKSQVLVRVSNDTDPGVLYYWDREVKSMDVVTEAMPGLAPELLSPVKSVSYAARDGQTLPGYLSTPIGREAKNLPAVILPHGRPAARSDKSFWYLTQFLVSRGYAVFEPNFRGSTGYGSEHFEAGMHWGGRMQEDVTDAAKWLVKSGVADPERLCVVGWSYGGYVAAMEAITTPGLYQCAASINGVLDLPQMTKEDLNYFGGHGGGSGFGLQGDELEAVSPFHQAERIAIPMLLIQANDDVRVHKEQAVRMEKRLRGLKKPVELVTVETGGHELGHVDARATVLSSLEQFLEKHIGE
ncbi:MAG: alpha/beta fold hydrolase [Gammaproteobacteria bacterium]